MKILSDVSFERVVSTGCDYYNHLSDQEKDFEVGPDYIKGSQAGIEWIKNLLWPASNSESPDNRWVCRWPKHRQSAGFRIERGNRGKRGNDGFPRMYSYLFII